MGVVGSEGQNKLIPKQTPTVTARAHEKATPGKSSPAQEEHHEWDATFFEGALEWLELIDKLSGRVSLFEANLRNSLIVQKDIILTSSEYVSASISVFPLSAFFVVDMIIRPKKLRCFHVTDKTRSDQLITFFEGKLSDGTFW